MSDLSLLTGQNPADGQLPEGWNDSTLGEFVGFQNGYAFKSDWYVPDGIRLVRGQNIGHGTLDWSDTKSITPERAAEFKRFEMRVGEIVLALDRPLISTGLKWAVVQESDLPALLLQRVARFTLLGKSLDPKFLQFWIQSPFFTNGINPGRSIGVPHISTKELSGLALSVPPLSEQEQIVEILEEQLSRLDAALESVRVVREKAAQFRRSLLHAAFTGTLTGHNPADGQLPEGWKSGTLIDAAEVTMGQSPPGSSYNDSGEGEPFFQGKAEFGALHPTVRKWTTAGTRFAIAGDILISVRAPVGPTNVADIDCVIGRGLAGIRAKGHVNQTFLLWNLRHFEHEIAAKGTGTTFDSISGNDLKSQGLNIPPLAEQEQIVEILEEQLSRLDAALAVADVIEKRSAALRRSLLHAAFTGRLTEKWRESVHV